MGGCFHGRRGLFASYITSGRDIVRTLFFLQSFSVSGYYYLTCVYPIVRIHYPSHLEVNYSILYLGALVLPDLFLKV